MDFETSEKSPLLRLKDIGIVFSDKLKSAFPNNRLVDYFNFGVTGWQEYGYRHEGCALVNNGLNEVRVFNSKTMVPTSNLFKKIRQWSMGLPEQNCKEEDYWNKVICILTLKPYQAPDVRSDIMSGFVASLFGALEKDSCRLIVPSKDEGIVKLLGNEIEGIKNLGVFLGLPPSATPELYGLE
mgnify:CR=1 FL=1